MASRTETTVVYAAGVVQGIALVAFPAASTIFTGPAEYDVSSTQYGALFLPILTLNALLGLGAVLAPVFVAVFVGLGFWLGLSLASAAPACEARRCGSAAFGIGPLLAAGVGQPAIYAASAGVAAGMGLWSLAVARRRPGPASLHPHLGHAVR